jgi:hypothetical protein
MITVQILPVKPSINEGKAKATGKDYRIVKQAALFLDSKGEAHAISVQPPRDAQPYAPGNYTIGPDSFYERDGELRFIPRLVAGAGGAK